MAESRRTASNWRAAGEAPARKPGRSGKGRITSGSEAAISLSKETTHVSDGRLVSLGPNAIDAYSPRCLPTREDWDAHPRTSKRAGRGTTEKTELRRLLDRTSQLFRRPADVGGLLIPVLWFGMDFKGAASKTRPSRIPPLGPEVAARVVSLTLADPPVETTHWTADLMAPASGISASAVRRIWKAHGLQPHRYRQFKLSNDPNFVDKLRDVVGLYVDPPAHAIVLSLDEKSQIQALDRTQPGLPLKKGRLGTMTHDYKRHGTTTLFAALNVLDGTVIGRNMQRHRHQEFMRFLNAIEAEVPAGKMVHVILDNYAAHKHPKVRAWLDRHERFVFHFTPTSCSWLNAVEGFFARLSRRRLKRGVFRSVVDLQAAINRFLAETNAEPKPFTWTADPDKIIAAVRRGHQALIPSTSGTA